MFERKVSKGWDGAFKDFSLFTSIFGEDHDEVATSMKVLHNMLVLHCLLCFSTQKNE